MNTKGFLERLQARFPPSAQRKPLIKQARKEFPALLAQLGFADGRQKSRKGVSVDSSRWQFWRLRDGVWDDISIDWCPRGQPFFSISFTTQQTERMNPQPGQGPFAGRGEILANPRNWYERLRGIRPYQFGKGEFVKAPSVEVLVADGCEKLGMLDTYLKTGEPRAWVVIYQPAKVKDGASWVVHPEDLALMEAAWARFNEAKAVAPKGRPKPPAVRSAPVSS